MRYEMTGHSLKIGDNVRVKFGDRRFGRIVGFESYEGSGLCFTDGMVVLESLDVLRERFVVAHGAVYVVTAGRDHDGI